MKKRVVFFVCLVLSMGICSQVAAQKARDSFEIKHTVYFEDMSVDEYILSKWDYSSKKITNQERYSASNAILERIELTYNEKDGQPTTKIIKDSESRLKTRVVYQYNPKGELVIEALRDQKNKPISTYEYAYNDKGDRTERVIKSGENKFLAKTIYTFDNNRRIIKSETKDASNVLISSTEYEYDSYGNLIKQKVSNGEGKLTSIINAVWQGGNEIKNEMTDSSGNPQLRVTKEYGQYGELLTETVENFQGESKQILKYEYEYRDRRN